MPPPIHIDGSQGEGGGQILRSALGLSLVTGRPFRITSIRAGRDKPGILRQHLACIHAAEALGGCAQGAAVGSREITFTPGPIVAGDHRIAIGSAGSTTLVLQAVLPALLRAPAPITLTIEGGTHNKAAPPFEFMARTLLPILARAGARITATIERPGFYPAGGGRIVVRAEPSAPPTPLDLPERGQPLTHSATALISRLPASIAARELAVVCDRLSIDPAATRTLFVESPVGPGNALLVELAYEHITEVFSAPGELGRSAELVARQVTDEARDYIAAGAPVCAHLADQLMAPLAALAGGRFRTAPLSSHALTNLEVLRAFEINSEVHPGGFVRIAAHPPVSAAF